MNAEMRMTRKLIRYWNGQALLI